MDRERATQIRVGFFVVLIFALFAMSMYILGQEKNLFKKQVRLYAYFTTISGLKPSSPVQLSGVAVGVVNAIELPRTAKDPQVKVTIKVNSDVLDKIREDSVATIDSQGLLGDKLINITIGSMVSSGLNDGDTLKTANPTDFNEAIETAKEALENIRKITRDVKKVIEAYSTPEVEKEVKTIIRSISDVSRNIAEGPGTLHEVIYDEDLKLEFRAIVANVVEITKRVDDAMIKVQEISTELTSGQGTLHGLIYEKDGKRLLDYLAKASGDIASIVDSIKTQKGPVHRLIYGDENPSFVDDLKAASQNIKDITDDLKKGKGTIGGLLEDPTIYEDLKSILGTLKRNEIIKSLVRYSLSKGDEKPAKVQEQPAPKAQ
jgi:phospholipid/cholesterol/gamma-HCH transport system substrate-binding protein